MDIKYSMKKGSLIVRISGEIDHHTSENIREKLDREFQRQNAKNIIFDFSDIQFMDSSGIGVIMGRYKNVKERGGKVGIFNVHPQIDRIFQLSGLYKIINHYHSLDEAVSSLQ
ncbi:anti-sigma F factor antagonist [Defluviitalea saccharophila]|uniref:Anti-sigma F factor antagonist n=1 Tax=Defluviitalea saccharophila TaxID=879970 RepID=A0ABZ2Y5U4_9FIRM|nr:anti-sigma F factor antagonist [Candidatus Epulonipiscium sp.]